MLSNDTAKIQKNIRNPSIFLKKSFGSTKKSITFAPAKRKNGGVAQLVRASDS